MTYNVFGGTLNLALSIYLCVIYAWISQYCLCWCAACGASSWWWKPSTHW